MKIKRMNRYPCTKGIWNIYGGIQLGCDRYTRITAMCNCGCDKLIDRDKNGYAFKSHEECRKFIEWEQSKGRVNKL